MVSPDYYTSDCVFFSQRMREEGHWLFVLMIEYLLSID